MATIESLEEKLSASSRELDATKAASHELAAARQADQDRERARERERETALQADTETFARELAAARTERDAALQSLASVHELSLAHEREVTAARKERDAALQAAEILKSTVSGLEEREREREGERERERRAAVEERSRAEEMGLGREAEWAAEKERLMSGNCVLG